MLEALVLKVLSQTYGVTVGVTITALPTIPTNALVGLIQVETNDIRAHFDSTNSVTAGVGGGIIYHINTIANPVHRIETWDTLNSMRIRANSSTASIINVLYLGEGQP